MPSQRYVQGTGMIRWNETTKKEVIYKLGFEGCIEEASLGVGCHRENPCAEEGMFQEFQLTAPVQGGLLQEINMEKQTRARW